jgi:ubiquitin carboxyl-terminal hydrolase 7
MLVPVAHFQREPYSTFGNPFLIKIKEGETYEEIKERIRSHIDVPEKDFEKYR